MGQEKGASTESRIKHNFGMARPEGYRKAVRLMELAERFGIPVLSIVDFRRRLSRHRRGRTGPGGSDRALDRRLPVARRSNVAIVTGEGMSGGAIADHNCQSRADVRTRDLQRDLAGSRLLDPVARRHQGPGSRQQA